MKDLKLSRFNPLNMFKGTPRNPDHPPVKKHLDEREENIIESYAAATRPTAELRLKALSVYHANLGIIHRDDSVHMAFMSEVTNQARDFIEIARYRELVKNYALERLYG